ncbi:Asp23/Gls24 family envelope stress response protein [Curtobacterium flaccumfaciens]|uniref:Asp23/Gls24 family envelope stress response protein n=1 Tax=Curtobacterium flaccumfaciens TaxID=2035 RepID=UPI00159B6087|nr:Asp23/Gls24 family envelope stress response protein [Curtobacterium flaccumfaciens]QKS88578.1 Asp23/Gls24 family envelope stress response protein [Curtobacterium flaccumfaciens pv. flaccumfaciens]
MQHDPNAHTQVTEVALPAELTEPLPDDASTVTIVARTAAETALGVPGVHHLGGIAARAADQLRKQLGRSAGAAGVQVDEDDGALGVQVSIVVSYPEPVLHVADEVRKQVTAATRQLSELPTSVDVRVLDVHGPFDDEQSPLGRATEAATDAVKQAAQTTADATKRAAAATADVTKRAADATAETTKRVVESATDTTEDVRDAAAESLARASEQAADAASDAADAAEDAAAAAADSADAAAADADVARHRRAQP